MKRTLSFGLYALVLIAFVSVSSCKKEDETQTVSYNLTEDTQFLYAFGSTFTQTSDFDITPIEVQNAFLTVGVPYDVASVNTAKLSNLSAKADYGTLSDISEIEVFIKVAGAGGDGVRIAHSSSLSGTSANALILDAQELKQFLNVTSTVTIKTTIKSTATGDVEVKLFAGVIQAEVKK